MFYRFKSPMATWDRLEMFVVSVPNKIAWPRIPPLDNYECKFIQLNDHQIDGVDVFLAPKFPDNYDHCLQANPGKEMELIPDIWSMDKFLFCSEKFKLALTEFDEMEHEYRPISVIDSFGEQVKTEQPYYFLNLRRIVRVSVTDEHFEQTLPFISTPFESQLLFQINQNPDIKACLERLPIWRSWVYDASLFAKDLSDVSVLVSEQMSNYLSNNDRERSIVYFSDAMWRHFQKHNISGLSLYSQPGGLGEESVVQIEMGGKCFIV